MQYLYIGNYSKVNGILICSFENGKLEQIGNSICLENPSYLHINKNNLYAVLEKEIGNGELLSFDIVDNNLILKSRVQAGIAPCHLTTNKNGNVLLTADYGSGTMSSFLLCENGIIDNYCNQKKYEGSSSNKIRQNSSHIHFVQFIEDDNYLCNIDLGADKINLYTLEIRNKKIYFNNYCEINVEPGMGPRHLVSNKNILYVSMELGNQIHVFEKNNKNKYNLVQKIPAIPCNVNICSYPGAIKMSKDRQNIYLSNRGHDSISVYKITENGKLEIIQNISCKGNFPRDIALDNENQYLLCANQNSNNITMFKRNLSDGTLSIDNNQVFNTQNPSCILFVDNI